jgi:hypothetical protein
MIRFFAAWMGLGVIATVVTFGVSLAIFRHVDLTFTQMAILLVAPAAQAAVLTWPGGAPARVAAAVRDVWRYPWASPVLVLDILFLAAGVATWSSSAAGFGAPATAQSTWIAVKGLVTAGAAVTLGPAVSFRSRCAVCVVALVVAGHAQFDLLERVFAAIDRRATVVPEVFLRLLWYGPLYGAAVAALLRVSQVMHTAARLWMSMGIAWSVAGLQLVLLSMFNNPGVFQPWRGLALVCASAAVTAVLLSMVASRRDGTTHS